MARLYLRLAELCRLPPLDEPLEPGVHTQARCGPFAMWLARADVAGAIGLPLPARLRSHYGTDGACPACQLGAGWRRDHAACKRGLPTASKSGQLHGAG